MLVGTAAGTSLVVVGCKTETTPETVQQAEQPLYGRTPKEIEHDQKVMAGTFLNTHELETIAILCDIILPATATAGSATEAEVPAFVEFIVKDLPQHQLPLRGGLMWLDGEANKRFGKDFKSLASTEQIQIIDDIAYPDPDHKKPEMSHGIKFFNTLRNVTLNG